MRGYSTVEISKREERNPRRLKTTERGKRRGAHRLSSLSGLLLRPSEALVQVVDGSVCTGVMQDRHCTLAATCREKKKRLDPHADREKRD